jgi:hypothetical protein
MTATESEAVTVKMLRDGYVFSGVARKAGEQLTVDPETFRHLLSLGFVRPSIRVRSLVHNQLVGTRVLAKGEEGAAPSEEYALSLYKSGRVDIVNVGDLSTALPTRRPYWERVRVIASNGFVTGDIHPVTGLNYDKRNAPGTIIEVPAAEVQQLVKQGTVARLTKTDKEKEQPAPAQRIRVRAAEAGQYGTRLLSVGELAELDLETAIGPLSEGRLVRVQEEPAAVTPDSAADATKSQQPPRP